MSEETTQPGLGKSTERSLGKIGKYQLAELIGEGAMGKVYRAFDPILSRSVAIKLMTQSIADDPHLRDRFLREARAAANLQHPNIITIYDFGETDGYPYIAMEFVEGTDLAHMIERREALSLDSKLAIVAGVLKGLGYAHHKGVVHRDIKPANIRITPDARVKIMDFGIAHLQGSEITHSGAVLGTPDYMAPEQVRGLPVTAQTDIFAAGAVLYELLTWEKPFTGDSLHAVLYKVVTEEPTPIRKLNPSLPENLERIVDTSLRKEPGRRYPTADAMAADLTDARQRLSELETVDTLRFSRPIKLALPPERWWERWWRERPWERWWRHKETRYAAAGAGGLLAVLAVLWATSGSRQPEPLMAKPLVVSDTAPASKSPPAPGPTPASGRAAAKRAPALAKRPGPAAMRPGTEAAKRPTADAALRAEVERAVAALERAIRTGSSSEIKKVYPALSRDAQKGWDSFFRNKRDLKFSFRVNRLDVAGTTATVQLGSTYNYTDRNGKAVRAELAYSGTLEKTGGAWVWKTLQ